MRIHPEELTATNRLESERDTLPFPEGGVFAGQIHADAEEGESEMSMTSDDVIASIDRLFDVMQDQIDTISEEVDHSLRMPTNDDEYEPRPAA